MKGEAYDGPSKMVQSWRFNIQKWRFALLTAYKSENFFEAKQANKFPPVMPAGFKLRWRILFYETHGLICVYSLTLQSNLWT